MLTRRGTGWGGGGAGQHERRGWRGRERAATATAALTRDQEAPRGCAAHPPGLPGPGWLRSVTPGPTRDQLWPCGPWPRERPSLVPGRHPQPCSACGQPPRPCFLCVSGPSAPLSPGPPPAAPGWPRPPPALQPHSLALGLFLPLRPLQTPASPSCWRPCAPGRPACKIEAPWCVLADHHPRSAPTDGPVWWRLGRRHVQGLCSSLSTSSVRPPHLSLRRANYRGDVPSTQTSPHRTSSYRTAAAGQSSSALSGLSLCRTEPLTDHEKFWFRNKQPSLVTSARNTSICPAALP